MMLRRTGGSNNRGGLLQRAAYALKVVLLLAALGVVIWVYHGDVYVALVLAGCAAGLFVTGIAPDLLPRLARWLVRLPFLLGFLIPLWQALDAVLRSELDDLIRAGEVLGLYAVAVLLLFLLPRWMKGPFQRLLSLRAGGAGRAMSPGGGFSRPGPSGGYTRTQPFSSRSPRPQSAGGGFGRSRAFLPEDEDEGDLLSYTRSQPFTTGGGGTSPFSSSIDDSDDEEDEDDDLSAANEELMQRIRWRRKKPGQ